MENKEWVCQKCGACCELFGRMAAKHFFRVDSEDCPQYDAETRLCLDYENRPKGCIRRKVLGDEYAIHTCRLLRLLRKWAKPIEDKQRVQNIIALIGPKMFGASEEQLKGIGG